MERIIKAKRKDLFKDWGIIIIKPKNPKWETVYKRQDSFKGWPSHLPIKPEPLVESGLFYSGICDFVTCFCCDVGISDWEIGNNPDIVHLKWSPNCAFMNLKFDRNYIERVIKRLKDDDISNGKTSICDTDITLPFNNLEQESKPFSCSICYDDVPNLIIVLPCGHMSTCVMCSVSVKNCPVCRITIKGMIRPKN